MVQRHLLRPFVVHMVRPKQLIDVSIYGIVGGNEFAVMLCATHFKPSK